MAQFITLDFQKPSELDGAFMIAYCTPDSFGTMICNNEDSDSLFIKWLRNLYDIYHDISIRFVGRKSFLIVKILESFCFRREIDCLFVNKSLIHVDGCDAIREGRWIHRSAWLEKKYGVNITNKKCITVVFMYYWLFETYQSKQFITLFE